MSHRYWRLIHTGGSLSFLGFNALELREALGGSDVTGSGTASASSQFDSSHLASFAFDRNGGTFWSTSTGGGTTGWIAYDFGAGVTKDIVEVQFYTDDGTRLPISFNVDFSDDGVTWTTSFSQTMPSRLANTLYIANASSITANTPLRLRVRLLAATSGGFYSWAEVTFNGQHFMSAFASSSFSGFPPSNAFDGSASTNWITSGTATTADYIGAVLTDASLLLTSVTLSASANAGEGARAPTSFIIEKSTDAGTTWTEVFRETGVAAWSTGEQRTYSVTTTGSVRRRLSYCS